MPTKPAAPPALKYKRIVLKLSGEVLRGGKGTAIPSTPPPSNECAAR